MAKKKYYAVRRGRTTGIFESWDECKEQVDGYPGAEFRGFTNRWEAEDWYNQKLGRVQEDRKWHQ